MIEQFKEQGEILSEDEQTEWQKLETKSSVENEDGLTEEDHTRLLQLRFMANHNLSNEEALERAKLEIKSEAGTEDSLTEEDHTRLLQLRHDCIDDAR